ncbi:hypothetical protein [Thauera aromatica]|uniref:hypothetical protein n=1 Tax=Thauera aromatica TaxID=59405 RepID=UPI001FFDC91B|nr:hypothetical protein [Thauera aromatica]MCK2097623.1 hypothetical protein [Thauera aromatica]
MSFDNTIPLRTLTDEVMPQLAAAEKLMRNTLRSILSVTRDPAQHARCEQQQEALDLELFRIRLNFDSLLRRHAGAVAAMAGAGAGACDPGPVLQLDSAEAEAVRSARRLCEQIKALRAGAPDCR